MLTIATMRLLGGRPSLDLVNTVDARRDRWGPDLLLRYDDLLVWSERIGLLGPTELNEAGAAAARSPEAAETGLHRIKCLREAIAAVFEALIEQRPCLAEPLAGVAAEADAARRHQRLVPADPQFDWAWHDEAPLDRVAHRVALDAATLLTTASLRARVKLCTGPNCGWLFLDETRNASRRWCREEGCGTQVRMLRYRAKRGDEGARTSRLR